MKRIFILLVLLHAKSIFVQDTLKFINGEKIAVKILEIQPTVIKYKRFDYLDGPLITVIKKDVEFISYQSGSIENLNPNKNKIAIDSSTLYYIGISDAQQYYRAYRSEIPLVLFSTVVFSPILGLFPTMYIANKKIIDEDRPKGYFKDDYYSNNLINPKYTNQSKMRKKKIWSTYFLASLAHFTIWGIIISELDY